MSLEPKDVKKFFVTTPIYYVNGSPHIGHAYTSVAADVLARWHRLRGENVFFLTGTDEHGQKVEQAAASAGMAPQEFADINSAKFRALGPLLNLSYDNFIRTTDELHKTYCQWVWKLLEEQNLIYLSNYEGWYSTKDECYYTEDEVFRRHDGSVFSIDTNNEVIWIAEPSYFFRVTQFVDTIRKHIEENKHFISPISAKNEVLALLDNTKDVCVSRTSFSWGIPVPEHDDHVMYVWLDALVNYISGTGGGNALIDFWPPDVQIVGKEIVRFHAIIWPALLLALNMQLPKRIFAHGWWTLDNKKIAKSTGNVIDPADLVSKFGIDRVRYYLLREMPFGNDGDFSETGLIQKTNADLANDLGNLAQRTLSIVAKRGGDAPVQSQITELCIDARELHAIVDSHIEKQAFTSALDAVWEVIRDTNAFISAKQPWKGDEGSENVLAIILHVLNCVACVLSPFMPDSMAELKRQLTSDETGKLPSPSPIFPRL